MLIGEVRNVVYQSEDTRLEDERNANLIDEAAELMFLIEEDSLYAIENGTY